MSASHSTPSGAGGTARAEIEPVLLTPEQAARALSIGRSKVYELIFSGALASVKIGGSRRIPVDALADFITNLRSDERTRA